MRPFAHTILLAALAVGLSTTAARAQDQGKSQAPGVPQDRGQDRTSSKDKAPPPTYDEPKPFVPPAASKSVEIGDFYFRKKQYNASLSRYEEAAKTDPYYPEAYLGLGKTYDKIGLKRKALDNYQKYLDLLPSEQQADEARKVHQAMARLERSQGKSPRAESTLRTPASAKSADGKQ